MSRFATGMGVLVLASVLLAAGSGCVAVHVGRPEVHSSTVPVVTTGKRPLKTEVWSVEAKSQVDGNQLKAWLDAQVKETYQRLAHDETTITTRQKRLAIGLFPGAAEVVYSPPGYPYGLGTFMKEDFAWTLMGAGIVPVFATIEAILFEPFMNWHEDCDGGWERWERGDTRADGRLYTHFGLIGVHKYLRESKTGPFRDGPDKDAGTEERVRREAVGGPYEVELRIAGTDIAGKAQVGLQDSKATFILPQVERGGQYEAVLTFQSLYSGADAVKSAWQTRTVTQSVWLQEKPKPNPVVAYTPPPAQAPVREVVKEIHHYHETRVVEERKPEESPWEIETVEAFRGGRAVYLVTIRDAAKKAFEVEREVRPEIERNLREAFVASMPGMDGQRVKAYAVAEYEGRAIRFRGVAFSVQPLTDGWRYDADTQRGSVRLRISEGMSPDEAKRWARENIEAIVKEKNVALEVGALPPSGAVYRSLGESLEDGVLTVEFEAVE